MDKPCDCDAVGRKLQQAREHGCRMREKAERLEHRVRMLETAANRQRPGPGEGVMVLQFDTGEDIQERAYWFKTGVALKDAVYVASWADAVRLDAERLLSSASTTEDAVQANGQNLE